MTLILIILLQLTRYYQTEISGDVINSTRNEEQHDDRAEEMPIEEDGNSLRVMGVDLNKPFENSLEFDMGPDDRKKGRRKEFKKKRGNQKTGGHGSASPNGQGRPKKRFRTEDDPFDIDRFSEIVSNGANSEGQEQVGDYMNSSRDCSGYRHDDDSSHEHVIVGTIEGLDKLKEDGFNEATSNVVLGEALGVQNLEEFHSHVINLVNEEGFQEITK